VEQSPLTKEEYVEKVLRAYRHTPGTMGTVRRPDRLIATQWYEATSRSRRWRAA
jgi:hypothetical protein